MHLNQLELTQIRLVAQLGETRNLTRAAEKIGLSPSAASHALARMRDILNDQLFVPTRAGFVPTAFGARLSKAASEAIAALSAGLDAPAVFDPATTERRFSAFLSQVGQTLFLPRLALALQAEAPCASFRAMQTPGQDPGAALASGEVDLAIGLLDTLIGGFHETALCRDHYVCIARSGNPVFRSGMNVKAFLSVSHAVLTASGRPHAVVNRLYEESGMHRQIKLVAPGSIGLLKLIADSDMVATVPSLLAAQVGAYLPLKTMTPPIALPPFVIKVFWHERQHRNPANKWLRNLIVKLFRKE